MHTDPHSPAELVHSMHQPWRASVGECLARWQSLDDAGRARSYLILHGEAGARRTLRAERIAELAGGIA
jgi:hypothetical protein